VTAKLGIAPIRRHGIMKTKSLFPRLGEASRKAWACLEVALMRSRVLPALIAGLNLIPAGHVTAQTFTTLYSFTALAQSDSDYYYHNSDGGDPQAGLILSGHTLYGTASLGGSGGAGTVFAMNTDGTGFTNLHVFAQPHYFAGYVPDTNPDGISPTGLILSGNTLYGTARFGGWSGRGTLFAVNTDSTDFTNLHDFTGSDGSHPEAGLILSGNTLYGTTAGTTDSGSVFALNGDGTGFRNLHYFAGLVSYTNSDGAGTKGLILSGDTLYGTAISGGTGNGTVFAVNTNGTGFRVLHIFTRTSGYGTNTDGANPSVSLILSGNTLYGTASGGGSSGNGTVFAVNTNGAGFRLLHSFTATSGDGTNSDGTNPFGLILSGSILQGTAYYGGSSGHGTLFAVSTNGTGFANLHNFTGTNSDLPYPQAVFSGNTLYGTTRNGGSAGAGTVLSLSFAPQLTITPAGTTVILSWPTYVAGFDTTGYTVQSTTNAVSSSIWSTNSPAPVVIAGQNTVTNPSTGARLFYRLVQWKEHQE